MKQFKILNLCAELRNRIYEYALYHDRDSGCTANVALLRTCKQVNHEAKGFMNDLATFTFSAFPERGYGACDGKSLDLKGDILARLPEEKCSVLEIYNLFPDIMLKASEVHIHMHLIAWGEMMMGEKVWQLGAVRLLYALAHFLNSDGASRSLHVICHDNSADDMSISDEEWLNIFSQLWTLRPNVSLACARIGPKNWVADHLKLSPEKWIDRGGGLVNPIETYLKFGPVLGNTKSITNQAYQLAFKPLNTLEGFLKSPVTTVPVLESFDEEDVDYFYEELFEVDLMTVGVQTAAVMLGKLVLDKQQPNRIERAREALRRAAPIRNPFWDPGEDFYEDMKEECLGFLCDELGMSPKELHEQR
ncbi:hypothetical protein PRZ48_010987 [Zasmidium cellare]|uniref:Uncharacterized protein n=1 Tax=Zasmidium cellare TaxID=395010 RepID=A0ABR0EAI0_ZASCE|nr:hypothetical protein PRZ48_010987 [Zasmidium cellare]